MNIIFDWSGTLADDQKLTWQLTNSTLESFSRGPVDFETYQKEFSIPVSGFYDKYCPGVQISEIDQEFFKQYNETSKQISLFAGMADFLKLCHKEHTLFIL